MNTRNFLIAFTIGAVVGVSGVFMAPASAQTAGDLQAQIQQLLARVAELTKQLNILQGSGTAPSSSAVVESRTTTDTFTPLKHRICSILYRNLSQGTQGDDVVALQEFLSAEGHFSAGATGYFGPLTAQAVAKWQGSPGGQTAGGVGPL